MAGAAFVAGVELAAPEVEKREGDGGVTYFIAQIVGDAAIGVDGMEVRAE